MSTGVLVAPVTSAGGAALVASQRLVTSDRFKLSVVLLVVYACIIAGSLAWVDNRFELNDFAVISFQLLSLVVVFIFGCTNRRARNEVTGPLKYLAFALSVTSRIAPAYALRSMAILLCVLTLSTLINRIGFQ